MIKKEQKWFKEMVWKWWPACLCLDGGLFIDTPPRRFHSAPISVCLERKKNMSETGKSAAQPDNTLCFKEKKKKKEPQQNQKEFKEIQVLMR